MNRKDIKAGVIYAVKPSYGSPSPIVFLEDGAASLFRRGRTSRFIQVTEDKHTKARRGLGWSDVSYGYATVVPGLEAKDEDAMDAMRGINAAAELERFRADAQPESGHLRFDLLTSLIRITPWNAAVTEYETTHAAERKRWAEAGTLSERRRKAVEALRRAGFHASGSGQGVGLTVEDAERLLALLAERTEG